MKIVQIATHADYLACLTDTGKIFRKYPGNHWEELPGPDTQYPTPPPLPPTDLPEKIITGYNMKDPVLPPKLADLQGHMNPREHCARCGCELDPDTHTCIYCQL